MGKKRIALITLISSAVCVIASAQTPSTSPKDDSQTGTPTLERRNPRYQVNRGDTLDLEFPLTTDYNQSVMIQPDGYVSLKGVGDLYVAGMTVPELTNSIRTAYLKVLHEPIVTVNLKDFVHPYFVADGEVTKPGRYDLRGDTTVTQAIAIAGGLVSSSAKHSEVLLFRRLSNDWTEVKRINVKKLLHAQNLQEDVLLRPGDMLYVPKNRISKIKALMPTYSVSAVLHNSGTSF